MPLTILIIEDDDSFRRVLELKLRLFLGEIEFTNCTTVAAAKKLLQSKPIEDFDLVFLDQHLPDGRGQDLLASGIFKDCAVISVSSDPAPDIPGATIKAGAAFFLEKARIGESLFRPLVEGIIDRNRIQKKLMLAQVDAAVIDSVRTLVSTLRHEINNPLGAVLGAAYLLRNNQEVTKEQREAAELVETSGKRIKHVLDQLCDAIELNQVTKAQTKVFHIPGDQPWETEKK